MMDQLVSEYILLVSSKKKKSLAARLEFEMNEEKVSVNPRLLFQRLSVATSTKTDRAGQESFTYKLCSYPPVFFDHRLLWCSEAKSELADAIWRQVDSEHVEKPAVVCRQCETDDMSTGEAWVKIRQSIDRGLLLYHIS